jgi:AraC-like DNA-binding protein
MAFDDLQFTIPEILSLIGLAQCVYILVYMAFRAGGWKQAALPFAYFLALGGAFFTDLGQRFIGEITSHYAVLSWLFWFSCPPLSVLLIVQIAHIGKSPRWRDFWVVGLIPLALAVSLGVSRSDETLTEWLAVTGLLAGAGAMLTLWLRRGLFTDLYKEVAGQERYWLVLTLIFLNGAFLALVLAGMGGLDVESIARSRTILGLGLAYLAGTSLFRLYPQAVQLVERRKIISAEMLNDAERSLAEKIETLLSREKVYQEPAYGRADLARELQAQEAVVSKVINRHFGKSLPQILNERRIEDAKRLLKETKAPVKIIADEVGFSSLTTFNRVFRDMTGTTPVAYRGEK